MHTILILVLLTFSLWSALGTSCFFPFTLGAWLCSLLTASSWSPAVEVSSWLHISGSRQHCHFGSWQFGKNPSFIPRQKCSGNHSRLGVSHRESFMPRHQWPGVMYDRSHSHLWQRIYRGKHLPPARAPTSQCLQFCSSSRFFPLPVLRARCSLHAEFTI